MNINRAVHTGTSGVSQVIFGRDIYKRKPDIKAYISYYVIQQCKKPGGLNSQGAVSAEMWYVCISRVVDVPVQSILLVVHATMEEPTQERRSMAPSKFTMQMVISYRRRTRRRV